LIYKNIPIIILLLCSIYLTSCENPIEDHSQTVKLSASGIILTDSISTITITKTDIFNGTKDSSALIKNAEVYISDEDGKNFQLSYRAPYYRRALNCKAGKKYYLDVKTEVGEIHGETEVPGDFEILNYRDNDTVRWKNNDLDIDLNWTKSQNAYGYIVKFRIEYDGYQDFPFSIERIIFSDKNNCRITESRIEWKYYGIIIQVLAYDKNYYYHHFEQYDAVGVTGAYGYFGSGVLKTVKLNLK